MTAMNKGRRMTDNTREQEFLRRFNLIGTQVKYSASGSTLTVRVTQDNKLIAAKSTTRLKGQAPTTTYYLAPMPGYTERQAV